MKRIKSNKTKKVLQSDLENYAVKKAQASYITGKMSKVIKSFQIEDAIKTLKEDDIMKSFVGVFPANHMKKIIDLKSMISEKTYKYASLIANTDSSDKDGT